MKLDFPMASTHFLLRDEVLRQVLSLTIKTILQCSKQISEKLNCRHLKPKSA